MSSSAVVHCVAVRVAPQGVPAGVEAPMAEVRRWTRDGAEAERWHSAATGSRLKSFTAADVDALPPKLRLEAQAHLG